MSLIKEIQKDLWNKNQLFQFISKFDTTFCNNPEIKFENLYSEYADWKMEKCKKLFHNKFIFSKEMPFTVKWNDGKNTWSYQDYEFRKSICFLDYEYKIKIRFEDYIDEQKTDVVFQNNKLCLDIDPDIYIVDISN